MTPSAPSIFRLAAGDLEARLAAVLALPPGSRFEVRTSALGGNAWNTVSVARHRIHFADGRAPVECVEKKLRKVLGVGAYEPVMQAWVARVQREGQRMRTPHLGVIETPRATFLYSENVTGAHAHLALAASECGAGVAEREAASAEHLLALPPSDAPTAWRMDFFRPWTLWRPRYNLALALRRRHATPPKVLRLARAMQPHLRRLALQAQASPRCFSHLDLISKNLIANAQGLHLIDWGEGRIGRFGFDAGSCLHRLLRGNDLATFASARDVLLAGYFAHLPAAVDQERARNNATWFLALRTLCYFLRPEVLRQHRGAPQAIEDKLSMLLAQLEAAR
ncbi:MAG: phosphotransferase family protein [Ramlibacter sp.]